MKRSEISKWAGVKLSKRITGEEGGGQNGNASLWHVLPQWRGRILFSFQQQQNTAKCSKISMPWITVPWLSQFISSITHFILDVFCPLQTELWYNVWLFSEIITIARPFGFGLCVVLVSTKFGSLECQFHWHWNVVSRSWRTWSVGESCNFWVWLEGSCSSHFTKAWWWLQRNYCVLLLLYFRWISTKEAFGQEVILWFSWF